MSKKEKKTCPYCNKYLEMSSAAKANAHMEVCYRLQSFKLLKEILEMLKK